MTKQGWSSLEVISPSNPDWMHLQLNDYDFYMSRPSLLDTTHGKSLPMNPYSAVPVIRIYGGLSSGHQAICHIHGVFPYVFIGYDGEEQDCSIDMIDGCSRLHRLLELKCQEFIKKTPRHGDEQSLGTLTYIANVSVVKAVPFYGFHLEWSLFYKISLLNPALVTKFSNWLRDGKIFGKGVETYETHLPYLLQFSVDFNVFGCSWMDFDKCYFRQPVLNPMLNMNVLLVNEDLKTILRRFYDKKSNALPEKDFPRMGNGLLEIDLIPQYIRNIDNLTFSDGFPDFPAVSKKESARPYVTSTKNIVRDIEMQRKIMSLGTLQDFPDLERDGVNEKWQSSDIFALAFKKFKQSIENSCTKNSRANSFSLANIKQPHELVSELWPSGSVSVFIPSETRKSCESELADTLEHGYNAVGHSDAGQSDIDNENERLDDGSSPFPEEYHHDHSVNLILPYEDAPLLSMDVMMTQMMARKRKNTLTANVPHVNIKIQKTNRKSRGIRYEKNSYKFRRFPIEYSSILTNLEVLGFPKYDYLDPFFGDPKDLKSKTHIYAGKRFEISSTHLSYRKPIPFNEETPIESRVRSTNVFHSWKYIRQPPDYKIIKNETESMKTMKSFGSQIEQSSLQRESTAKKRNDEFEKRSIFSSNTLTHFSMEIHVETEGSKNPDPLRNEVKMIVWCVERESLPFDLGISHEGILIVLDTSVDPDRISHFIQGEENVPVAFYDTELELFDALIDLVLFFDADILSGFEVHDASWGYIIERCRKYYQFEIAGRFSRVNSNMTTRIGNKWSFTHASGIMITGRHMINVWRSMRSEVRMTSYSIENLAFELLGERLPRFSFQTLTKLWKSHQHLSNVRTVVNYWMTRVRVNIRLLRKQDYISRIIELAKLTGIDFYSVYSRGSQYKVESLLFRLCKEEGFLLLSPSRKQVRDQKALQCVPLVMEPESAFYKSPVVVLDFQSLYPSVMIAYNLCYSTMLGRVRDLKFKNELGVTKFPLPKNALGILEEHSRISANGVLYVKSTFRRSILAKMLEDLLHTRMLVKKTMNEVGSKNISLQRLLNRRQLALKLIANVTYGYTSASFSGRMPCSDLADTIVETGREILESAIELIEGSVEWGAKVVYGDTDSLFVYLPGKSRTEAYTVGQEIAMEVTKRNRSPICLKLEKLYHPSILLSKKRYVGFMYEFPLQVRPTFDAKGIETVRRDGHPAQRKIVKRCIQILFRTKDLSEVKKYVQKQFLNIHKGNVSLQDFCFAREVHLGSYKNERTAPPGAVVAARLHAKDYRTRPQYKERVPYVIVRGSLGQILRERCVSPEEFLADETLELDPNYYIEKTLVPPISRLFNIMGVNVAEWAYEVTRCQNISGHRNTTDIEKVFSSLSCTNCGKEAQMKLRLCQKCRLEHQQTVGNLVCQRSHEEKRLKLIDTVCRICSYRYSQDSSEVGNCIATLCESHNCPVYFDKIKGARHLNSRGNKRITDVLDSTSQW